MDDVTAAKILISCLDLTSLGEHDTEYQIEDLCARAETPYGHVAAVCIWPQFVALAKKKLKKRRSKLQLLSIFRMEELISTNSAQKSNKRLNSAQTKLTLFFPTMTFRWQFRYLRTFYGNNR